MSFDDHHSLNTPVSTAPTGKNFFLVEVSPKDGKWDKFRQSADSYKHLYKGTKFNSYADRISDCSKHLVMSLIVEPESGESYLHLESARFCRVPRCPICEWRRSLKWRAKVFKVLPRMLTEYPSARFLFLTLTVKNCPLDELRATLIEMNAAWRTLTKRKSFPAIGWIKAVEVTRAKNDYAHPHFHCLLMVQPSYFQGKYYLSKDKWIDLWQGSLGVDYAPSIDIQAIKSLNPLDKNELISVLETVKYSVKSSDVLKLETDVNHVISNQDWLVMLTEQLYKMRLISTGGVFKNYLRDLEDDNDLIHINENFVDNPEGSKAASLMFTWNEQIKRYMSASNL
jgi:plasmid rolling circle replication initiator protein Rep